MSTPWAEMLELVLVAYAGLGLSFALVFVFLGVGRVDPAASQSTWGFRLIIVPGCMALWPVLAWRWARGVSVPTERNPHRDATRGAG